MDLYHPYLEHAVKRPQTVSKLGNEPRSKGPFENPFWSFFNISQKSSQIWSDRPHPLTLLN
jgi:hypothetical protein